MSVFKRQLSQLKKPVASDTVAAEPEETPATAAEATKKRRAGKSSNPDYKIRGVLIHKKLQRQAENKWADEGHKSEDLSDIVEHALKLYVGD